MERISKEELIFGLHSVREALKTKKRQVSVLYIVANKTVSKQVEEVIRLAKTNNVKIKSLELRIMDNLASGGNHQGVDPVLGLQSRVGRFAADVGYDPDPRGRGQNCPADGAVRVQDVSPLRRQGVILEPLGALNEKLLAGGKDHLDGPVGLSRFPEPPQGGKNRLGSHVRGTKGI